MSLPNLVPAGSSCSEAGETCAPVLSGGMIGMVGTFHWQERQENENDRKQEEDAPHKQGHPQTGGAGVRHSLKSVLSANGIPWATRVPSGGWRIVTMETSPEFHSSQAGQGEIGTRVAKASVPARITTKKTVRIVDLA